MPTGPTQPLGLDVGESGQEPVDRVSASTTDVNDDKDSHDPPPYDAVPPSPVNEGDQYDYMEEYMDREKHPSLGEQRD
jgi:hypothetical protein